MQIAKYFLLELSLIFGYKLGMGKGSWVYADSVLCEDWEGGISSYDSVPVLQKLDFCVDLSTSQGVCLVSHLLLFGYTISSLHPQIICSWAWISTHNNLVEYKGDTKLLEMYWNIGILINNNLSQYKKDKHHVCWIINYFEHSMLNV
jgi:hypothetical protein